MEEVHCAEFVDISDDQKVKIEKFINPRISRISIVETSIKLYKSIGKKLVDYGKPNLKSPSSDQELEFCLSQFFSFLRFCQE